MKKNPMPPIFVSAASSEECSEFYCEMWANAVMQDTPKCYQFKFNYEHSLS